MPLIHVLDEPTINQIAAGEVVERPSAVVKELIENAMDAGATAITAEIKEGGLSFIRITDNGAGIAKEDIPLAFLRHATSKIRTAQDLLSVTSLGFRGEALSSIAAVAQVELITKTPSALNGFRYLIEGGEEKSIEEIGCPGGTTIIVRNLFFNTPARRKFLKSAMTEAGYISDLMERLLVSHPDVSFKFIVNNQVKLQSSGNHSSKDILYHVYGRDVSKELLPVEYSTQLQDEQASQYKLKITGYIGKPTITRGNRNFENYFINGRYIKSNIITKAIEEAYKPFMMQHKFPFTSIYFEIDPSLIDVNVHPQKLEIRLKNGEEMYQLTYNVIRNTLAGKEMIPRVSLTTPEEKKKEAVTMPEPFEENRRKQFDGLGNTIHMDGLRNTVQKNAFGDKSVLPTEVAASAFNNNVTAATSAIDNNTATATSTNHNAVTTTSTNHNNSTITRTDHNVSTATNTFNNNPSEATSVINHNVSAAESDINENTSATTNLINDNASSIAIKIDQNTRNTQIDSEKVNNYYENSIPIPNHDNLEEKGSEYLVESLNTIEDRPFPSETTTDTDTVKSISSAGNDRTVSNGNQLNLFTDTDTLADTPFLSKKALEEHRIIGQVFSTYWLVEYKKELYIIDQHAAHEKVLFERIMNAAKTKTFEAQQLLPPIVLTLTLREQEILHKNEEVLTSLGYEFEHFGGNEYSVRAVPADLYGLSEKDLLLEFLDEMVEDFAGGVPGNTSILERVASLSCKAAVKANHAFSYEEAAALIKELLTLENPYNCPHGRPVIISMSQYELERKFKRIV